MNLFGWLKRSKLKREIIVNVEKLETRVAVMENGRIEEFMVEHPEDERLVGSVFKGRIQNLENDLQAAFVDIGLSKNAFLHYWDMTVDENALLDDDEEEPKKGKGGGGRKSNRLSDAEIAKRFPPGSEIIVQVTKGPISTKGPRVTANLSIPGRYLVMMPGTRIRGVSTLVFAHVFINIAMSIGLVPITGLPLPFISAGRTFLVTVMAGLGIVQSVSIHRRENDR